MLYSRRGDHGQCLCSSWPMSDPRSGVYIRNRSREPLPPLDIADRAALGLLFRASGHQFPAPSAVFMEDNWPRKEISPRESVAYVLSKKRLPVTPLLTLTTPTDRTFIGALPAGIRPASNISASAMLKRAKRSTPRQLGASSNSCAEPKRGLRRNRRPRPGGRSSTIT